LRIGRVNRVNTNWISADVFVLIHRATDSADPCSPFISVPVLRNEDIHFSPLLVRGDREDTLASIGRQGRTIIIPQ